MHLEAAVALRARSILRHSPWDAVLVALSFAHALALLTVPSLPLVAVALWWNANTIVHNFIHAPFFQSQGMNAAYSVYLSLVQGIPQTLWRHRHLAHHAGRERPFRWSRPFAIELGAIAIAWMIAARVAPDTFLEVYLPGYAIGLVLCYLQGHFEHAGGATISHYGRLYNLLFFNDGYHVEHHRRPGVHWTRLPLETARDARSSRWPPVLRWLDTPMLELLERIALRSSWIQDYVLGAHERAFRAILPALPATARVTIVGGGLFPRTALILRKLRPGAALTIIDASGDHLDVARAFLHGPIEFREQFFDPRSHDGGDLIVIPLSFIGNRDDVYRHPPARAALVHDWLWNARGQGVRVSWLLLKRLNLVTR